MRRQRLTASALRKRQQDRQGMALIAACFLIMGGWLFAAYKIDQAHGITVCQSLAQWGFGRC